MSAPLRKTALVLGAGANIGTHVAAAFKSAGYAVAVVSRTFRAELHSPYFHVAADLADPDSITGVFEKVEKEVGVPSVVVYNAAGAVMHPAAHPLALTPTELSNSLATNTLTLLAALRSAHAAFTHPTSAHPARRAFIYTGNGLLHTTWPALMSLGASKCASAHLLACCDAAYAGAGMRFFYADERKDGGALAGRDVSGEAAAEMYVRLAEGEEVSGSEVTFVKGKGVVKF